MHRCNLKNLQSRPKSKAMNTSVFALILVLFLSACMGGDGAGGRKSSKSQATSNSPSGDGSSSDTPVDPGVSLNSFLQNGSFETTSVLPMNVGFSDSFFLRGDRVNDYISQGNQSVAHCLLARFTTTSVTNKLLILLATPKSFYNFSTGSVEHYFQLEPSNFVANTTFCNQSGLVNKLSISFPTELSAFQFTAICPTCSLSTFASTGLQLYTQGGGLVTNVEVGSLSLTITTSPNPGTTNGQSCSSSQECLNLGFDCCTSGQCVKDGQIKDGVSPTDPLFLQAEADILSNPSNVIDYPNFFHICPVTTVPTPAPTPTVDPVQEAADRFEELRDLFRCTTPQEGEMAICTKRYKDASTLNPPFETGKDDMNFETIYTGSVTTPFPLHSIVEIAHGGEVLFFQPLAKKTDLIAQPLVNPDASPVFRIPENVVVLAGKGNDTLSDPLEILFNHTKAASAPNDDLVIRFKIDGSCESVNSILAKCFKLYTQGQDLGRVDDHANGSNEFKIPLYADLNRVVTIEVDDAKKLEGSHWNIVPGAPSKILFLGTGQQIFDKQVVKITYFVDTSTTDKDVLQSKMDSLNRIDQICNCGGPFCLLQEVFDPIDADKVIDYACLYPQPDNPDAPFIQQVIISSKTIPMRYFDQNGSEILQGEIRAEDVQEGVKFEYTDGNLLKPNNLTNFIGFNEIYGSMSFNPTSPKPAKRLTVENGKTYDIFVDFGTFSTCFFCGVDYYSAIAKVFPRNLTMRGGGYKPHPTETDRFQTDEYRSDDLLFGRACWLPATMLPWSHGDDSDQQTQRLNRLKSQHFLFANGYQKDWYGFDYGSVIGSFDGVTWFSVGNQRRIKASTNRLFLAINGYFADLTTDSSYQITVQESVPIPGTGSFIDSDFESDGAECQKFHICEKDSDCISQLGYDYACEDVTNMYTPWPTFDINASEVPSSGVELKQLIQLLPKVEGGFQRCVYRARGAPCHTSIGSVTENNSYIGKETKGLLMCNQNTYCQKFIVGSNQAKFNNRISRFGKSVATQNASGDVPEDDLNVFGLSIRSIGRPLKYNGDEEIEPGTTANLINNKVQSICIPGREPDASSGEATAQGQNDEVPSAINNGDEVFGLGMTLSGDGGSGSDLHYLSSCGILSDTGDYIWKQGSNPPKLNDDSDISNNKIVLKAASQAISTNAVEVFEGTQFGDLQLVENFVNFIEFPILQNNRCLRAPGSACFTDMECAPSSFIANKMKTIPIEDQYTGVEGSLLNINKYEVMFWQEELVCSQKEPVDSDDYDLRKNFCCRESDKDLSIGPQYELVGDVGFDLETPKVEWFDIDAEVITIPTVNLPLSQNRRYSRHLIMADLLDYDPDNGTKTPPIVVAGPQFCDGSNASCLKMKSLKYHWKTTNEIASRTCCSGHWVRNFHEDNGGGHQWDFTKTQTIDKEVFKCVNWNPFVPAAQVNTGYSCDAVVDPQDSGCPFRNLISTGSEVNRIFEYFGRLELLGIPSIAIPGTDRDEDNDGTNDISPEASVPMCSVQYSPVDDNARILSTNVAPFFFTFPGILKDDEEATNDNAEYMEEENEFYYSADDPGNFETSGDQVKMLWSKDSFSCCTPAGEFVHESLPDSTCCTGNYDTNAPLFNADGSRSFRCVMPDYTDLSLYFNRHVSSGAKDLDDSLFNSQTGYFTSPSQVEALACQLRICASGTISRGVALNNLPVPGQESSPFRVSRFIQQAEEEGGIDEIFDAGARWNTHVYCIPANVQQLVQANQGPSGGTGPTVQIITCP